MGFTVIMFVVLFVGVYLVFNFIFDDMLKKEKYTKISELVLLTKKFDLDKKKMDYKKALNGIALINALSEKELPSSTGSSTWNGISFKDNISISFIKEMVEDDYEQSL